MLTIRLTGLILGLAARVVDRLVFALLMVRPCMGAPLPG